MFQNFQASSACGNVKGLIFLSILVIISLSKKTCFSQNTCLDNYIQLDEASGFDLCGKSMIVDDAVRMLMDSLAPVDSFQLDFRDSMGVYGFGFYRLVEKYEGYTVDDILDDVIANEITHKYYVLFARESTEDGIFKKYHVRSYMPKCFVGNIGTPEEQASNQSWIEFKLQEAVDNTYGIANTSAVEWANAEKSAIDWLSNYAAGKRDCCFDFSKSAQGCDICVESSVSFLLKYDGFFKTSLVLDNPTASKNKRWRPNKLNQSFEDRIQEYLFLENVGLISSQNLSARYSELGIKGYIGDTSEYCKALDSQYDLILLLSGSQVIAKVINVDKISKIDTKGTNDKSLRFLEVLKIDHYECIDGYSTTVSNSRNLMKECDYHYNLSIKTIVKGEYYYPNTMLYFDCHSASWIYFYSDNSGEIVTYYYTPADDKNWVPGTPQPIASLLAEINGLLGDAMRSDEVRIVLGFTPVVGEVLDITDIAVYLIDGNIHDAAIATTALVIPVGGTKLVKKAVTNYTKGRKFVRGRARYYPRNRHSHLYPDLPSNIDEWIYHHSIPVDAFDKNIVDEKFFQDACKNIELNWNPNNPNFNFTPVARKIKVDGVWHSYHNGSHPHINECARYALKELSEKYDDLGNNPPKDKAVEWMVILKEEMHRVVKQGETDIVSGVQNPPVTINAYFKKKYSDPEAFYESISELFN